MDTNLEIAQGALFEKVIQWMGDPVLTRPMTAVAVRGQPCRLTVPAHGLPPDWLVAAPGLGSCCGCSSTGALAYVRATVIDANTIELPSVNCGALADYVTDLGLLYYRSPRSLVGWEPTLQVRDDRDPDATLLYEFTVGNGRIVVDTANYQIRLGLTVAETEAITWTEGFYDMRLVNGPTAYRVLEGQISVSPQVTV